MSAGNNIRKKIRGDHLSENDFGDAKVVWEAHPSWRGQIGFYAKGFVAAFALTAVVIATVGTLLGILAAITTFSGVIGWAWLKRYITYYKITDQELSWTTGILSRSRDECLLARIQNKKVVI